MKISVIYAFLAVFFAFNANCQQSAIDTIRCSLHPGVFKADDISYDILLELIDAERFVDELSKEPFPKFVILGEIVNSKGYGTTTRLECKMFKKDSVSGLFISYKIKGLDWPMRHMCASSNQLIDFVVFIGLNQMLMKDLRVKKWSTAEAILNSMKTIEMKRDFYFMLWLASKEKDNPFLIKKLKEWVMEKNDKDEMGFLENLTL